MRKFSRQFKQEIDIDTQKPLVVSVSGGVDSMVMLDFLRRMGLSLVVVHFNHQKRAQSEKEADMVREYAKKYELPFNYYKLTINSTSNFQNRARILRRRHLQEVARRNDTPYILTAHHLDDLLENILISLTKGGSLQSYAGMRQVHQQGDFIYVKPFLYHDKDALLETAKKYHIPYMEDDSNYTTEFLRNRYRLTVIPIMKQENENLLTQAKHYNQQLISAYDHIRKQAIEFLEGRDTINIPRYRRLDRAVQDEVIAYLLEEKGVNLNYRLINRIRKVLLSKKPNQTVNLSGRYQLVKFYEKAEIKPSTEVYFKKIKLKESDGTPAGNTDDFFYSSRRILSNELTVRVQYDEGDIVFPLWARNRIDGDKLEYDYGHKKLKKLLIDEKVPMDERNNLWVITDDNDRILWIPNYYINQTLGKKESIYISFSGDKNND